MTGNDPSDSPELPIDSRAFRDATKKLLRDPKGRALTLPGADRHASCRDLTMDAARCVAWRDAIPRDNLPNLKNNLVQQGVQLRHLRGEGVGIVRRRILQQLKQGVDRGADFRGVGRRRVAAGSDEQRVESHSGLLGSALALPRNFVGVAGYFDEQARGHRAIVGLRLDTRDQTIGNGARASGICGAGI